MKEQKKVTLTVDDIPHHKRMITVICRTIEIINEIDQVIGLKCPVARVPWLHEAFPRFTAEYEKMNRKITNPPESHPGLLRTSIPSVSNGIGSNDDDE